MNEVPRRNPDTDNELLVRIRLPLDRFDLDVNFTTTRRVTGVFGPSGSGKSSLLETVAGLRRRAEGFLSFNGDVWLDSARKRFVATHLRGIGYVPQDGLLFPHLDVRGNLLSGARRAQRSTSPLGKTFESVVDLLELESLLKRDVGTLSGGERQRVALGRAICSGPRLLLLDEPLSALDLPLRRKLLPFIRRIRDEYHIPMLHVSHDPLESQALCDELIVLDRGSVIARGEPRKVLTDPAIFPLAEREGFQNILPGRLVENGGKTSLIRLETNGPSISDSNPVSTRPIDLITLAAETTPGASVLVGIAAHDIMIATICPRGLSAKNILPARVVELHPSATAGLVVAAISPDLPPLTIEVTETTFAELDLRPNKKIFVIIKATSCQLYKMEA